MAKGRRARTKELYNTILAACRQVPGNHLAAASIAGVDRGTLKRVYWQGWPEVEGCLPIKDVLHMDQIMLRAARHSADPEEQATIAQQVLTVSLEGARESAKDASEMLQQASQRAQEAEKRANAMLDAATKRLEEVEALARAKMEETQRAAEATMGQAEIQAKRHLADLLQRAKVDAAETMADEAAGAKFARKAALGAAALAALVLKDASSMATALRGRLDFSNLSPMQAIRVAREMVQLVEAAEKSVILALQAERLRVGQPTEIIGTQSADGNMEEREIKIRAIQRAMEKAKAHKLTLVKGEPNDDGTTTSQTPRVG